MSRFVSTAEKILSLLVEYGTLLATILGCAFLVISSQIVKYDDTTLLIWLIGLVGLLALGMVVEKHFRLVRIEKKINNIESTISHDKSEKLVITRKELTPLENRLADAQTITITGGSLKRISDEYLAFWDQKVSQGCRLEVILVTPHTDAANLLCDNVVYEINNHDTYSATIEESLKRFQSLKKKYGDKVTIRTSKKVPPFSLIVSDEGTSAAKIKVELYSFVVATRDRMQFFFDKKNKEEFDFYIQQLKTLRDTSVEVSCE